MRAEESEITAIREILVDLKKSGCKCWIMEDNCIASTWGLIVTPNDNLLTLELNYYGGYTFTFEYKPTRECGTGCRCFEKPVGYVNISTVIDAERCGYNFAKHLGATLYRGSKEAFNTRYKLEEYVEI